MRLLILGGTGFLSGAVARAALAAGLDVTCAARGLTGAPPPGARFVRVDRADGLEPLKDGTYDAVLDISSEPGQVRAAVAALAGRVGHWTYVSSCSAYADQSTPGQRAATAPVLDGTADEYGHHKVACERAVLDGMGEDRALVCRAGLIVGPGDPIARYAYWPLRLARGGEVLAPGAPDRLVQYIDVADLADWLVRCVRSGLTGTYDGVGPSLPFGDLLAGIGAGVGVEPRLTWVDQEFLAEAGVEPWIGERSLPLWLPLPEYAGFLTRDVTPSLEAGLTVRPIAETARDTLDWWRVQSPQPPLAAGLSPADEAEVLAAWHAVRAR